MHCKQTHVQIEIVHSWASQCGPEWFRIGGAGHGTFIVMSTLVEIGAMTNNCNPLERERVVTPYRESRHILIEQERSNGNYIVHNFCQNDTYPIFLRKLTLLTQSESQSESM